MSFEEFMEMFYPEKELKDWQRQVVKSLMSQGKSPHVLVSIPPTHGRGWFLSAWEAANGDLA